MECTGEIYNFMAHFSDALKHVEITVMTICICIMYINVHTHTYLFILIHHTFGETEPWKSHISFIPGLVLLQLKGDRP